jgi:hypothetical protein
VSGRGFLDEAAAAILAQILEKRGLGVRTVPFAEAASARLARFEPGPAQMACVVSLALDGEPTHLRRLIRRLKGRMPGVPILLGLWLTQDEGQGRATEQSTGADGRVVSLREAVEAVLAAAERKAEPQADENAGTPSPSDHNAEAGEGTSRKPARADA